MNLAELFLQDLYVGEILSERASDYLYLILIASKCLLPGNLLVGINLNLLGKAGCLLLEVGRLRLGLGAAERLQGVRFKLLVMLRSEKVKLRSKSLS